MTYTEIIIFGYEAQVRTLHPAQQIKHFYQEKTAYSPVLAYVWMCIC